MNQIGNPHDCFFRGGEAHARLSREEVNPDLVDLTEAGLRDQFDQMDDPNLVNADDVADPEIPQHLTSHSWTRTTRRQGSQLFAAR